MTEPRDMVNVRYMVDDVDAALDFYTPGGSQILLQDPSGNLVELFQPAT